MLSKCSKTCPSWGSPWPHSYWSQSLVIQSLHGIKEDFSPLKGSALIFLHLCGTLDMFTAKSILLCPAVLMLGALFLPVDNVVPSRFWASAFRPVPSGCSKAKVPRFQTGYVSFRFHSPGLYLVFSQDDKGILVSKQQNPWKKAGAALKGQVEERGWSVVRWITELQNWMAPLWYLGLKGELYHL